MNIRKKVRKSIRTLKNFEYKIFFIVQIEFYFKVLFTIYFILTNIGPKVGLIGK